MSKETRSAKRNPSMPDALEGFVESLGDKPEHATDFAQEIAGDLANPLDNSDGISRQQLVIARIRIGRVGHIYGQVALVQGPEKRKVRLLEHDASPEGRLFGSEGGTRSPSAL